MRKSILILSFLFGSLLISSFNLKKDTWVDKAEKAMRGKNYTEAISAYSKALDSDPKNVTILSRRGQANMFANKFEEAIKDFTKIIQINPSLPDVYNYRGLAYGYIDEVDKSISDFDKAIGLDSKFSEAYLNRGTALASKAEYEKAIKDYNRTLKINPKNAEAYYQRGRAYYNLDNLGKSIENFTKAIENGLKSGAVFYNRGNSHFKLKNYAKAIQDYNKALEIDPKDTEALNNRAMAYDLSGNKKAAQSDRERLNKLAGNRFPPINTIKFVKFTDTRDVISIELPDDWNKFLDADKAHSDLFVTVEKIDKPTGMYSVGVKLSMNRNMRQQYNLPSDVNLMDFWQASIAENTKDYYDYRIFTKKTHRINGYEGFLNTVSIRITKETIPIRLYELILSKGDDLFYGYFQSPEVQFSYFEKIFDKSLKTLWIK